MESHAEFLRRVTLDESLATDIKTDFKNASLDKRERAMLEYVSKLTLTPRRMQENDIDSLREVGFDDVAILQVNLIASWFNYINRVADGLGVGKSKVAAPTILDTRICHPK